MVTAFDHVKKVGGITLASKYPYKANDTFECKKGGAVANISGFKLLEPGDEEILKEFLIKFGPIAIAIDASLASFQSYKSGVYFDAKCSKNINHAGEGKF